MPRGLGKKNPANSKRIAPVSRQHFPHHLDIGADAMLFRRSEHKTTDRLDRFAAATDDTTGVFRMKADLINMHPVPLLALDRGLLGMLDQPGDDVFEEFLNGEGGFHRAVEGNLIRAQKRGEPDGTPLFTET